MKNILLVILFYLILVPQCLKAQKDIIIKESYLIDKEFGLVKDDTLIFYMNSCWACKVFMYFTLEIFNNKENDIENFNSSPVLNSDLDMSDPNNPGLLYYRQFDNFIIDSSFYIYRIKQNDKILLERCVNDIHTDSSIIVKFQCEIAESKLPIDRETRRKDLYNHYLLMKECITKEWMLEYRDRQDNMVHQIIIDNIKAPMFEDDKDVFSTNFCK